MMDIKNELDNLKKEIEKEINELKKE